MSEQLNFLIADSGEAPADLIARFELDGEPQSKARARSAKRGNKIITYSPHANKIAEAAVRSAYLGVTQKVENSDDKAFAVRAIFYHATRQRRDVDNMLKLILDGLNKAAWADDTQVVEVSGRKVLVDKSEARTVVEVYQVGQVPRMKALCENCKEPFTTYPSWENVERRRKYCSAECRSKKSVKDRTRNCAWCKKRYVVHSKTHGTKYCSKECHADSKSVTIPCATCGTPFRQYKSWAESRPCCSPECSYERIRKRNKAKRSKHFPGTCLICGSGTTRKEYKRCNPCKLAGKKIPA